MSSDDVKSPHTNIRSPQNEFSVISWNVNTFPKKGSPHKTKDLPDDDSDDGRSNVIPSDSQKRSHDETYYILNQIRRNSLIVNFSPKTEASCDIEDLSDDESDDFRLNVCHSDGKMSLRENLFSALDKISESTCYVTILPNKDNTDEFEYISKNKARDGRLNLTPSVDKITIDFRYKEHNGYSNRS